ncbi:WXG100 family type VII secretion target [Kitasatospora sp. NPDC052896]|uniref:WXG100 family type VII secretion target n=1 Tax=Kitasatospora sp. NPDC052896 TaxID=3364061 RepID=UPI0037CA70F6
MTTYSVQMAEVNTIVDEMASITRQIQQMVADLDSQSTINLQEWTADSKDLYTQVRAQWDNAATDMTDKANMAVQMLGTINEYYYNGERAGSQLWV